jgi:hypothetical protein
LTTVHTLDPVAHPVRARVAGLLFWIVLPVLAIVAVVSASLTFAHRIDRQPVGTAGTFVATLRSCDGNVCQIAGTFTSDDQTLVVRGVLGDYRWKIGERHRVVLNPSSEVIALPASWSPVATVVGGSAAALFLIGWLALVAGALGRHRRRVRLRH